MKPAAKPVKASVAASSDDSRDEPSDSEEKAFSSSVDSSSEEETAKPTVEMKVEVVDLSSDGEVDPVAVAARRYLRLLEETKEARKTLVTVDYGKNC